MTGPLDAIELRSDERLLVYGIGNVGRQDDGLGIRLVERLERDSEHVSSAVMTSWPPTFESNYQLGIEDALLVSRFDVVLFLDASRETSPTVPFALSAVFPAEHIAFTTHAMGFSSVLSICEELYGQRPRAFLLAIPGYEWGISEDMSHSAGVHLDDAFISVSVLLEGRRALHSEPRLDRAARNHA